MSNTKSIEIYILRHGTTVWNREHRIQGSTDIPLDPTGAEMARQTGRRLRVSGIRFDRVYSSPLSRACETAALVAGEGCPVMTDPRIRELGFGRQEGCVVEEMIHTDVPFRFFKSDPLEYDRLAAMEPSMESLAELVARTADFLRKEIESPAAACPADGGARRILISGHGALNKGLLMHMRGEKDLAKFWGKGLQPNCGIDIVRYDPGVNRYRLLEENRVFYPQDLLEKAGRLL